MSSVTVDVHADEGEMERGGGDGNGKHNQRSVSMGYYPVSPAHFTTSLELNS